MEENLTDKVVPEVVPQSCGGCESAAGTRVFVLLTDTLFI